MDESRHGPTPEQRLHELFQAHYADVLAYAKRRVDDAMAQEVVADVFVAAWMRLDALPADPLPWLYRAASFEIGHRRREHGQRQRLEQRLSVVQAGAPTGDPSETVVHADRWAAAFTSLSVGDQEVLRLTAWEALSSDDAAKVVGCSVAAFKVRLHRARRRLRDRLHDEGLEAASPLDAPGLAPMLHGESRSGVVIAAPLATFFTQHSTRPEEVQP